MDGKNIIQLNLAGFKGIFRYVREKAVRPMLESLECHLKRYDFLSAFYHVWSEGLEKQRNGRKNYLHISQKRG